jgi:uncharacterized protein YdcH (DUF465 family)
MNVQEIPQDLKYAAIQHSLDHMKAQFARHEELANRIKRMEENYKREIYELLGSKAAEFSKFYEKRNEVARTMRPKFTFTPEGEKMEREFKKTRLAEADEFFKNLGINVNDIKSIRKKYSEVFGSLTEIFIKLEESSDEDKTKSNPEGL